MNPVVIKNLKKSYENIEAVNGVSFEVYPEEIFGLIGPDGAGKTTLMRILVSLIDSDEGDVFFKGKSVKENVKFVRSKIGYMPQRFSLYPDLTVNENLRFFGDLFKVPAEEQADRMRKLYEFSKLEPFRNRRADALSGGMKQKLALSSMLMHQPEVIVLDEPTFGVDPVSRSEFWDILKKLRDNGTSILVSTAYMDEAGLCDRVALMFGGKILAQGKPGQLLKNFEESLYLIETDRVYETFKKLENLKIFSEFNLFGDGIHIVDNENRGEQEIIHLLNKNSVDYKSVVSIEACLEDLFLKLIPESDD
ncbi:MAG: ABC transporter ATP-binding protein [Fibrobacter sp.]|nr:ABC transporter ATP-binding protein [Fibrobacter sp.]